MKVLVIYASEFGYQPAEKNLESAENVTEGASFKDSVVAFIQVEETDETYDVKSREKKLVNHLKWTARKNNSNKIILHSFAHLSERQIRSILAFILGSDADETMKQLDTPELEEGNYTNITAYS